MTEKPLIFVSYASPNENLAKFIGSQIEAVLDKERVDVFVSTIGAGDTWFPTIQTALDRCEALVVLVTPASIDRRWVWFEIGYVWAKTKDAERHIYPLAISHAQEIPHPLSEHQGKFLDSREEIENFFRRLCDQFGFGILGNANIEQLIEMARNMPRYPNEENLSEPEIKDFLLTYLKNEYTSKNKPIRFSELDDLLRIPRDLSKKHLGEVAQNNGFTIDHETDNTITVSHGPARVRRNPLY